MPVSKAILVNVVVSALILGLGALAVKDYKVVMKNYDGPPGGSILLDYLTECPLGNLNFDMSKFSFNPIGLVLLLATLSVNTALGSLTCKDLAEYLPTLSSHTTATNGVIQPLPGYTLYNVTDKIRALDVAGWFSKFLASQNIGYISTSITLKRHKATAATRDQRETKEFSTALLAFLTFGILSRAAYYSKNGFATINVWAVLGLVICRHINIEQLRRGLGKMVKEALPKEKDTDKLSGYSLHTICKVWLTTPSGNAVQVYGPRGLVRCMLMTPQPASAKVYNVASYLSGVLFGIQALTLGLTSTGYQTFSLSILALSTMILTNKTTLVPGTTTTTIGNELELTIWENKDVGTHMSVYADMGFDADEEESMRLWGLMPHASNKGWWVAYEGVKEKMAGEAVEAMD